VRKSVAIFGATSHIAKGLIDNFCRDGRFSLHLFGRSIEPVRRFIDQLEVNQTRISLYEGYQDVLECDYDVLINCVGVGTADKLGGDYSQYFTVNEYFDNLSINYINRNPDSLYVSISSGVVYGRSNDSPYHEKSLNCIDVNHIRPEDYYSVVRLNAETKHRAHQELNIVDLRVFSYFNKFCNINETYLVNEMVNSIKNNVVFETNSQNIWRDYMHPDDLYGVIEKCILTEKINKAFDMVSRSPVSKFEMLDFFSERYGLDYMIFEDLFLESAGTGHKGYYFSVKDDLSFVGYDVKYGSLDALKDAADTIIGI